MCAMRIEQFIVARLDEDEVAAQDCGAKNFHMVPRFTGYMDVEAHYRAVEEQGHFQWFTAHYPGFTPPYAHHIARHDPARALRQVAAMRAILADHADDEGYCSRCWDGDSYAPASRMFPCPTIRSLAAVWSDHPDFHRSWASDLL